MECLWGYAMDRYTAVVKAGGPALLAKILANAERVGACLLWKLSKVDGYGIVYWAGRQYYVHRVKYAYTHELDPLLQLDHSCPHRHCLEDVHLEQVTAQINVLRGRRSYDKRTNCNNGHPLLPANVAVLRNKDRKSGRLRRCRICHRETDAMYKARRRERERVEVRGL